MGEAFDLGSQLVIGGNNPPNQRMPDDIAGGELDLLRTLNPFQDPQGIFEAGTCAYWQVDRAGIGRGDTSRPTAIADGPQMGCMCPSATARSELPTRGIERPESLTGTGHDGWHRSGDPSRLKTPRRWMSKRPCCARLRRDDLAADDLAARQTRHRRAGAPPRPFARADASGSLGLPVAITACLG